MASIWNGSEWVTTRLTENGSQEFDPVIAVNGSKAIAVWRSVQTDESAFDFTQNRILCRLYDGAAWSDKTYTLYNGSAGEVTGMTAGMLADGTAAVAFCVADAANGSDIYYTVVHTAAENPEDDAKTIRATTNSCTDENPQLTTVGDRFVLGWSSVQSGTGAEQHDVGLRVFDSTGGSYKRTVTVTITAADGSATRTYTIYLNPAPSQSSGADYCTLTFETNGGSKIAALRKIVGSVVDLTVFTPTRSGYIFTGWYADKALTEKITEIKLSSSKTVYAGWQEGTSPFVDVLPGSYYHDAVLWAVENNITTGTSATTFSPDVSCTRAQSVTFLWRAAGSPAPEASTMPFTDVKTGSYYYNAVLWAVENGITKGTGDTTFSPDATCSRAQIVTFLWRSQNAPEAGAVNPFTDVKAGDYYADAVLWAVKEDVTKGTTDTTFSPDADCTRAQIVTFIWRALTA